MTVLNVRHTTIYRYSRPVMLGDHRLMLRPRDSHDLRLLSTTLVIDPPASAMRWIHDVFGNSIAIVTFNRPGERLVFEPYSKQTFEESFEWIEQHGIFPRSEMGTGKYESSIFV